MQKGINLLIIGGLLLFGGFWLTAQNSTNSPYTRYGYGDLANRSFGAGRSMGGIGIGLHTSKQINPMNPASYACMDSMTFLFDFGASFQASFYDDGTNKQNDLNGNVEYMALQFPLLKRMALSAGLMPFSHVGYRYGEVKTSNEGHVYTESFQGIGGLNQLYAGLSIELWKKRLSIGANANYLFGSITHTAVADYVSANTSGITGIRMMKLDDVTFDFGIQYVQPLSKTDNLNFGLIFSPKKRLNNVSYETITNGSEVSVNDTIKGKAYDYPDGYGIGISYVRENKLIAAVDYSLQRWSDALFDGEKGHFSNRSKISAGFEYIPNLFSRPYLNRTRYRAGLSYSNSYMLVEGNGYKELGASLGTGFPMSDARSFVNFSLEYVKVVPDIKTMINENYFRVTLSYTFNEWWFMKRKVD